MVVWAGFKTRLEGFHTLIVMSHIGWGGEQITIYKGVETFPQQTHFKALRESPRGKAQRGQYLLAMDLGPYMFKPKNPIMCIVNSSFSVPPISK